MQVLNLNGSINTPGLNANINTLGQVLGVQNNYNDVVNKPQINSVTLVGNISSAILNIKTSDLVNDAGYITNADIPTKTSDLINDSDFTTGAALTAAIASVTSEIPTATSDLINDSGFITSVDIPPLPTKTSDLVNDSGYITAVTAPVTSVNGLTGDVVITASNADYEAGTTIKDKIDNIEAAIPTATSDLNNDSGFVTGSDLPTNVSQLNNDAGYITAAEAPVQSVNGQTGAVSLSIPTDTSELTNGANFITAAEAPVQSVNTLTGNVILTANDISGLQIDYNDISNAGASVILQDAADNMAVVNMTIDIAPIQATGTPTPSNPLPITGLTDVIIVVEDSESNQTTNTIALGQTVYGGTLNVTTGELVITHAYVDLSSFQWTKTTASGYTLFATSAIANKAQNFNFNCEIYKVVAASRENLNDGEIGCWNTVNSMNNFCIRDDSKSSLSASDFTTAITGNYVCYETTTPTTLTIIPTEIKTYSTQCTITVDSNCNIANMRYFNAGGEFLINQIKKMLQAYNLL